MRHGGSVRRWVVFAIQRKLLGPNAQDVAGIELYDGGGVDAIDTRAVATSQVFEGDAGLTHPQASVSPRHHGLINPQIALWATTNDDLAHRQVDLHVAHAQPKSGHGRIKLPPIGHFSQGVRAGQGGEVVWRGLGLVV